MRSEDSATFKEKAIGVGLCVLVVGFFSYASYTGLDAITAKNNCKDAIYKTTDKVKTASNDLIDEQLEYRKETGYESSFFFPKTVETIKKHDLLSNEKSQINNEDAKLDNKPFIEEINKRKENSLELINNLIEHLEATKLPNGGELTRNERKEIKSICSAIRQEYQERLLNVPYPDRLKEQYEELKGLNKNLELELKLVENNINSLEPRDLNEIKLVLNTFIVKCKDVYLT